MNSVKNWIHIRFVILWALVKWTVAHNYAIVKSFVGKVLQKVVFVAIFVLHGLVLTPSRVWRAVKLFFNRLGFMVALSSRYYKNWSHLYQWLYERKQKDTVLMTFPDRAALQFMLHSLTWTADGVKELGDAFRSAGYIQSIINAGGTRSIGDCDEFAMYNSSVIRKSVDLGIWKDRAIKDTKVMTVRWADATGKYDGHNVCLIEWMDGKFSYIDYYTPSNEADSYRDVMKQVLQAYGGVVSGGWAVSARDLTPLQVYWK